ncbi:hypothetical protein BGZ46_001492, partial [Entomortierella lignicola]
MQSIKSLQETARHAAGTFLTPLANAIAEQRRLVESLSLVSKVRVEECKHMMTWSKYQDVLLKLNLLIRKISDYELRFGTQYEQFREKIKFLRTKDDTLCEAGRMQTDLVEASLTKLKSAKNKLLQRDDQAQPEPGSVQLQQLKRKLIKEAYTHQMDSVIELGRKLQIIGEHGKKLLDHIDESCSDEPYSQGRATEDILQAARISLENWDQDVTVLTQSVVVSPPSPVAPPTEGYSISSHGTTSKGSSKSTSLKSKSSKASVSTVVAPPLPPRNEAPATPKPQQGESDEDEQYEQDIKRATELSLAEAAMRKDIEELSSLADKVHVKEQGETDSAVSSRIVRGPQAIEPIDNEPKKNKKDNTSAFVEEELGDSSSRADIVGEASAIESMGESRDYPYESLGDESTAALESMGPDGNYEAAYTPSVFSHNGEPRHKIQTSQLKIQELQQSSPFPSSPELQYLQVSPQIPYQPSPLQQSSGPYYGGSFPPPAVPSPPTSTYKPTTQYVAQTNKTKNRHSGPITPPPLPSEGVNHSQLADQKAYQLAHQQSYQQGYKDPYSSNKQLQPQQQRSLRQQQHFQEQKQKLLQEFYYTPNEQEQWSQEQEQYPGMSTSQQTVGNWNYPNPEADYHYKEEYEGN